MRKVDILRSINHNPIKSGFDKLIEKTKKLILYIQCLRTKI